MESQSQGVRGRARGRARDAPPVEDVPGAEDQQQQPEAMEVYAEMYGAAGGRRSSEESNNGNGSNGNGSNGNGRGGAPRGMLPSKSSELEERTTEQEERAKARERALLSDYVVSKPEGFMKKGSSCFGPPPRVVTNYYKCDTSPDFNMRLYAVRIEPPVEEAWKIRKLIATKKEQMRSYMSTGLMLFTTRPIQDELLVFQAALENEPDVSYTVHLEFRRDVDRTESTMFQFYNVVVRQMQAMMDFKLLGRHFFDPTGKVEFPNWRLELWPGFQNSLRQQEQDILLNVESVWKVLQKTSIFDLLRNLRQQYPDTFEAECENAVRGMMVITPYNKKAYKISRIDFTTNPTGTFETKRGPVTYIDYYRTKYNVRIHVERQPMLISEPRERERRRGQGDIFLVPELCYPCGLNDELRSNFRLMKDLASCLHMPPTERVSTMQNFVQRVTQNAEINTTLLKWGIKVRPEPVEFEARYLKPESIIVGGNNQVAPDEKADWTNAFRNQRMLTPMRLTKWAIIVTSRDSQGVSNLVGTMQRVAGPLGYQIQQPQIIRANDIRQFPSKVQEVMSTFQGRLDLLFAILPNNNPDNYAAVKKRCSVDFGIPSQCFLSKNLTAKGLMSICTKMVIQMNAKQGGEPWGVVNPLKNVMVLGYDVHHAGPGGGCSIGAMCAALSQSLGRYYSCVSRIDAAREEVATTVAMMFDKCLKAYEEKNGVLPARIFMYRDGVGEGQLKAVFEQEVQAFKDRIKAVYEGNEPPKLTYVVVNKRINTRFFQKLPSRQFQNPKPGLIVDDVVTRPERYDFFLISQTARQGCVSPTYYNVLFDESQLPPDRLQMYTYKLCHLYYNWSGTVAVPAPCQNAHKLALQVGTALKRPAHDNLSFLLHFL